MPRTRNTTGNHVRLVRDRPRKPWVVTRPGARMLLVPVGHRLAGKESVTLDDIEGEPISRFPDPEFDGYWRIDPRPGSAAAPGGPPVETIEDKLEYIAAGQAVAIVPAALYAAGIRPDLTTVPLRGVELGHVVAATRATDRSRLVAAFRASARDCLSAAAAVFWRGEHRPAGTA